MPRHDYQCEDCDHLERDVITRELPPSMPCECGGQMFRTFANFRFNSHLDDHRHNKMYGKFHAGFGEVVESYEHKQELLRKYEVFLKHQMFQSKLENLQQYLYSTLH